MLSRRRHSSSLLLALLLSLAAHVAAGLIVKNWQRLPVEPPHPLVVTLEAAPPRAIEQPPPPTPIERNRPKRASNNRALPISPLPALPAAPVFAQERAEPTAPAVAPAAQSPPAPAEVAKAPPAANPPARAEAVEPPQFNVAYLNNPRPAYPSIARKLGLEGVVVLRVHVSAAGKPEQVRIAKSSGASVLDDAALKAVQSWTFVPGRRGETPIAHLVDVPIRFELKN